MSGKTHFDEPKSSRERCVELNSRQSGATPLARSPRDSFLNSAKSFGASTIIKARRSERWPWPRKGLAAVGAGRYQTDRVDRFLVPRRWNRL